VKAGPPPGTRHSGPAQKRNPISERRSNRGALLAHLERIEEVIEVAYRARPSCWREMHRMSEDRAERLDVVPTQLRARVTIRPR
jgi:transposase